MSEESHDKVNEVTKACGTLNRRSDNLEESLLMSEDPKMWSETLYPCLSSVALLGQLMLVATKEDFPLNDRLPPTAKIDKIKYPDSFRTTLVQICNDAFTAYNTAHKSMEEIKIVSDQIPNIINQALKIIVSGTDAERKSLVPPFLEMIKQRADECKELAERTEGKYADVMELINEVYEVSVHTSKTSEQKHKEAEKKIHDSELRERQLREEQEMRKKEIEQLTKVVKDAETQYRTAIEKLPGNFTVAATALLGSVIQGVTTVVSTIVTAPTTAAKTVAHVAKSAGKTVSKAFKKDKTPKCFPLVATTLQIFQQLQENLNPVEGHIEWGKIKDGSEKIGPEFFRTLLEMNKDEMRDIEHAVDVQFNNVLERGLLLCEDINIGVQKNGVSEGEEDRILKTVESLCTEARALVTAVNGMSGTNPTPQKQLSATQSTGKVSNCAANIMIENAQYKVAETKEQMVRQQERYDMSVKELREKNEQMTQIMIDMANSKIEKLDLEAVKKILKEGTKALASVRTQWAQLVQFFQRITVVVSAQITRPLIEFKKTSESVIQDNLGMSALLQEIMYTQVNAAVQTAHQVNCLAIVYSKVSSKYLMGRVIELGELAALDPVDDQEEIENKQEILKSSCLEAQKGMTAMLEETNLKFRERAAERMKKIEATMYKVLPAPSEEEKRRFAETLQKANEIKEKEDEAKDTEPSFDAENY